MHISEKAAVISDRAVTPQSLIPRFSEPYFFSALLGSSFGSRNCDDKGSFSVHLDHITGFVQAKQRSAFPFIRARRSRSRGVPCESLDASDNLPGQSRSQVVLRQLQDEVPCMSD
jgi:hypothetical protein